MTASTPSPALTGTKMTATPDAIDLLAGIAPGSPLDGIRAARQQARDNAQGSYLALFEPAETAHVSLAERFVVATFVCALHRQETETAFYRRGLEAVPDGAALAPAVLEEAARGAAEGPKGHYPAGALTPENTEPPAFALSKAGKATLGPRLSAALAHAHFLVFHPRDAGPERLRPLLEAGWSATGIVTLSQIVAFLAFQLRVIHGLRALARSSAAR